MTSQLQQDEYPVLKICLFFISTEIKPWFCKGRGTELTEEITIVLLKIQEGQQFLPNEGKSDKSLEQEKSVWKNYHLGKVTIRLPRVYF